jgi:hypothetical protein
MGGAALALPAYQAVGVPAPVDVTLDEQHETEGIPSYQPYPIPSLAAYARQGGVLVINSHIHPLPRRKRYTEGFHRCPAVNPPLPSPQTRDRGVSALSHRQPPRRPLPRCERETGGFSRYQHPPLPPPLQRM